MTTTRRIEKMTGVLENRQPDLTVVCENIHDPHNVSAIFRTCDAVGIEKVHLIYTNRQFPKIGKKSSASAKKWIEREFHKDAATLRRALKQFGFTIYGSDLNPQSQSIYEVDWTQPSAIIMGNEHLGISEEVLKIADSSIYIPMFGMIQSLNVSVATAVILYEACRQRLQQKFYPHPQKTPEILSPILEKWKEK
jgi:tRNA (guanosine-2'-O-)-methyltransferase